MKNRLSVVAFVVICGLCSPARADWPMARHDPQRTAQAAGQSNITDPVPYWRMYLGGAIASTGMRAVDIDGDGQAEILIVSGGRLVAKRPSDAELWSTPPRNIQTIIGVADLDGDSVDEVIVRSLDHVYVHSLQTGALLWAEPDGEMGTIGAVRMADFTGDGAPELLIVECGCCSISSGNTGFVYSFASGLATPTLLWTPATVSCGGYFSLTIVDADGVAPPEVMLATANRLSLYDGQTGTLIADSPPLGTWVQRHRCTPANVDGIPGDEIVCIQNTSLAPATNQRRVTVMKLQTPTTFGVLWTQPIAPDIGGDVRYTDPVQDLDGDGTLEVIVAGQDAVGLWTTHVFDAATGADLGTIAGEFPVGAASIETAGKKLLLTTDESNVIAWRFDRASLPALVRAWTLPDRDVLDYNERSLRQVGHLDRRLVTMDLSSDGIDELLTVERSTNSFLFAYTVTGGTPVEYASHALPQGTGVLRTWVVPPTTRPTQQVALAHNDGFLVLLDNMLAPTSTGDDVIGPGIRIGGYYAPGKWRDLRHSPVVAALTSGPEQTILIPDSRGSLLAVNAAASSAASPPSPSWQARETSAPTVVDGLVDGEPGLACIAQQFPPTTPPSFEIKILRGNGSFVWAVDIERNPIGDLVPGVFNRDGVPDLVAQWGDPADTLLRTRAFSGADGSTLWDAVAVEAGAGRQPAGMAVTPWDGDGLDDVIHQVIGTQVLAGADGTEQAFTVGPSYFMPIVYDIDDDAETEIILHAGVRQTRVLSHDLATRLYITPEIERSVPYGSVAECGTNKVLLTASWAFPARLKLTSLSAPTFGDEQTIVLAGGNLFATEADATNSGAWLGQLTVANVHQNLTGSGSPAVVVGSNGGWLYAVNPCTAALEFSRQFDAAVGETVFGDTDGDGRDEMIVTVADGYLYLLRHRAIAEPSYVWDIDPDAGIVDRDVGIITTTDSLSGRWEPINNVTGYEVAIVDANGTHVATPTWRNVGTVTQTQVSGLPLENNRLYRFVVRSLSADGPSVDAISDGVVVQFPAVADAGPPDAGAGATPVGCGCRVGHAESNSGHAVIVSLGLVLLVAARIRRRRTRP